MSIAESTAVEAAALARLPDYLRRAQPVSEHDELIARDAYMSAWRDCARWVGQITAGRDGTTASATMTFAQWMAALAQAHWDLDYTGFCQRAGFVDDTYAESKWHTWVELQRNLKAFDSGTLQRIVRP